MGWLRGNARSTGNKSARAFAPEQNPTRGVFARAPPWWLRDQLGLGERKQNKTSHAGGGGRGGERERRGERGGKGGEGRKQGGGKGGGGVRKTCRVQHKRMKGGGNGRDGRRFMVHGVAASVHHDPGDQQGHEEVELFPKSKLRTCRRSAVWRRDTERSRWTHEPNSPRRCRWTSAGLWGGGPLPVGSGRTIGAPSSLKKGMFWEWKFGEVATIWPSPVLLFGGSANRAGCRREAEFFSTSRRPGGAAPEAHAH